MHATRMPRRRDYLRPTELDCYSWPLLLVGAVGREGEEERAALSWLAFGPDPAAVAGQNAMHDGQPNAAALEFGRRVQPLERVEQFVRVAHVEPGAVVTHEKDRLAVLADRPEPRDGAGGLCWER